MNPGIERIRTIWADGPEGKAAVVVGTGLLVTIPIIALLVVVL